MLCITLVAAQGLPSQAQPAVHQELFTNLPGWALTCRDKLKAEITRMEMEKADLGIELSFQRDRLKLKEAEAQQLELDALELGARLSKSATDYVSWIMGRFTDTAFPLTWGPTRGTAPATGSQAAQVCHTCVSCKCRSSHSRAVCIKRHMRGQTLLRIPELPLSPCPFCCHLCAVVEACAAAKHCPQVNICGKSTKPSCMPCCTPINRPLELQNKSR